MSNLEPYYKKGEKHLCIACGDLLYFIAVDIFAGDIFSESMITCGQNFLINQKSACKKCGKAFDINIKDSIKIE